MRQLAVLTGYEYRKLMKRRMVWISLAVICLLCVVSVSGRLIGNFYINRTYIESNYQRVKQDIAYGRALSGTPLDEGHLKEAQEAYGKIPEDVQPPMAAAEYEQYARPWQGLWSMVENITGTEELGVNLAVTEEQLYEARQEGMEKRWESSYLTEGEKSYLRQLDSRGEKPLIYEYADGWSIVMELFPTLGVLQLLLVAICVPMIFSEEHSKKTRGLIQCTPMGRKPLYTAKIITACSFSVLCAVLFFGAVLIPAGIIYGFDGFGAQLRSLDVDAVWLLNVGQVVLIMAGMSLITALVHSVFALVLAEKTRSSLIPMAVMVGMMLLGMLFSVPVQYRVAGQVWDSLPFNVLAYWNTFSTCLFPVFGKYFVAWQVLPLVYAAGAGVLIFVGWKVYGRVDK